MNPPGGIYSPRQGLGRPSLHSRRGNALGSLHPSPKLYARSEPRRQKLREYCGSRYLGRTVAVRTHRFRLEGGGLKNRSQWHRLAFKSTFSRSSARGCPKCGARWRSLHSPEVLKPWRTGRLQFLPAFRPEIPEGEERLGSERDIEPQEDSSVGSTVTRPVQRGR